MKAMVLHEYGPPKNLKYEDMPDPTPSDSEILVRVAATSVNPIDYKMRSGAAKDRFPIEFPAILGRDIAGTVRAVGSRVKDFKVGDKIIALGWKAYAELAIVDPADATLLPDGLDLPESAALPLVVTTGDQLARATKLQPGQTLLVSGAIGGVGRTAVWTAKKSGVKVIAGVRKSQLKQAEDLHADAILALDDPAALDQLGFLDAVANTVPGDTANKLLAKVKPNGIFASVVGPPSNAALNPTVQIVTFSATRDAGKLHELAEDVKAGHFKIPIDRMLPLEQAPEAHTAAEKGGIGKILLIA
jgi:NADPH:quinone reductase-like Zn-dependent oxidoreductase